MFSKSSRETSKPEIPTEPKAQNISKLDVDQDFSANLPFPDSSSETTTTEDKEVVNSELVNTVEKISRIVSPYFVVVVGLSLYDDNFLIGAILIVVGILSLFKVSLQDLTNSFNSVKNFFGLGDN